VARAGASSHASATAGNARFCNDSGEEEYEGRGVGSLEEARMRGNEGGAILKEVISEGKGKRRL